MSGMDERPASFSTGRDVVVGCYFAIEKNQAPCSQGKCFASEPMQCPTKVAAMKRMGALMASTARVSERRGSLILRGAPSHVLAELLADLEDNGWSLVPDRSNLHGADGGASGLENSQVPKAVPPPVEPRTRRRGRSER